ncbi:DUF6929 family protein [Capnocytophaga cynodegmi]|uniref:DUF6929 family protein n=1 Tax=Capnocytophaga cynodegmi TaxID=28189 RepID=UPI001EE33CAB|nr:hypothetical protein [Capnocytophaga cynodegmi]
MNIEILKISNIEHFPSGSGLAASGGKFYAIGDDSPFLYVINSNFQVENRISLLETSIDNFKGNRIKKKIKPDFETLEMISENELVVFGSGSKSPQRDVFVRVLLNENSTIESYSITEFYEYLKRFPLLANTELNIEASAFSDGFLYLFNRSNNVIVKFDYQDFLSYLKTGNLPKIEISRISLPEIEKFEAGFSGATFKEKSQIIFTASVEATDDAYNDGEIIGSLVGVIDVSDFQRPKVIRYNLIPNNGENPIKVESITILSSKSKGNTEVVFITDDDNGNTKLIKASLKM